MNYKEVEDYSDYIIFKTGKIWSKKRNRFLTPWIQTRKSDGRQVYTINLSKNGKGYTCYIARLLGFAFIYNDDPINKIQIDHIDRNPLNNDLSNLMWVTLEEQSRNRKLQKSNKLGLRFIIKRNDNGKYRVRITRLNYDKTFKTEEEAIIQRNSFLDFMGEDYENIDK